MRMISHLSKRSQMKQQLTKQVQVKMKGTAVAVVRLLTTLTLMSSIDYSIQLILKLESNLHINSIVEE